MKSVKTIFIFTFIGILFSFLFGHADKIPTEGNWGEDGPRSIIPAPPAASLEGNTVFIEFKDALSNLTVSIIDINGDFYYQETISSGPNSSCQIPQTLSTGEYTLFFNHRYGVLTGNFTISD